jgi:NAD-dependent deacetylase
MKVTPNPEPARCADLLKHARNPVALTGAGISTSSGIPDFRGPKGLYVTRRYDPEKVFDIGWFYRKPEYFYEFSNDFIGMMIKTRPSFSHGFLARLEKSGHMAGIITQNIDALHQQAGSEKVLELHGSYRTAGCIKCGERYGDLSYEWWERAMRESPRRPVAVCCTCGGVLKPDIVFFGEAVRGMDNSREMVESCDLLLVLGSSLQVMPASFLPNFTDSTTIVINRGNVGLPPGPNRFFVDSDLDAYCREVAIFFRDLQ